MQASAYIRKYLYLIEFEIYSYNNYIVIIMKKFSLKIACIFIILMYCLAPLSALDLNQDDNNKYINQETDDSSIAVKDVNVTKETTDENKDNVDAADVADDKAVADASSVDSKKQDVKKADDEDKKLSAGHVNPKLSIRVQDTKVGNKQNVEIYAVSLFSGDVVVSFHGDLAPHTVHVKNGYARVALDEDLMAGTYTATVKFDGDDYFKESSAKTSFTVGKGNPNLDIKVSDIAYGEKAAVEVTGNKAFTGDVVVSFHGDLAPHKIHVENGYAKETIDDKLAVGIYTATVKFDGNENFVKDSSLTYFTVHKANPDLGIKVEDVSYGEKATVEITAIDSFTGDVYVSFHGPLNPHKVHVENGQATVTIDEDLAVGPHTATVSYAGNANYKASSDQTSFRVHRADPNLSIKVDDIDAGEKATVEISGNEIFTGDVYVSFHGELNPHKVHVEKGQATATIDEDLIAGPYTANVSFSGNGHFKPSSSSTTFVVRANIDPNLGIKVDDITEGEKAVAVISANETLNGDARVMLNGSNAVYPVTIVDGSASVIIDDDLAPGDYNATVRYLGDNTFKAAESSTVFKVSKNAPELVDPNLTVSVKDITFGDKALVSVSTDSAFSGNVGVDIGSKHLTVKVANGKGSVSVSGLAVGTYTAKATFNQTETFNASVKTTKFAVKKANVKITAKAKTFKYSQKTKKYAVTLKDNKGKALKGKKVSLKVNGKTYTAKTNAKGVATFKLAKSTKVGAKNAVISFAGDKSFNKASKKAKITVKFDTVSARKSSKLMVKEIQRALKRNHFYLTYNGHKLLVDGWYYIYTTWAVKKFQAARGLKVTGKVDYKTARKLKII